jgi:probable HAF family extracellular repeat protein
MFSSSTYASTTLEDEGTGQGVLSGAAGVNDNGIEVGHFVTAAGIAVAFVRLTPGVETPLPALTPGQPCRTTGINNSGLIVGFCRDSMGRNQAVAWTALQPSASPRLLAPRAILGIIPDVRTAALAINSQGAVVGISTDSAGISRPELWPAGSGTPIDLPFNVLGLNNVNCAALDVADGSGATPTILGSCPDGHGRARPVIWTPTGIFGNYVGSVLSIPASAQACDATEINVVGHVLGSCDFGASVGRKTVRWGATGGAPIVLSGVNGFSHSHGIDMNASGQIAGNYTGSNDFINAFYWNPDTSVVSSIPPVPGGATSGAVAISDSGVIVGNSDVSGGQTHPFEWTAETGTSDDGTLSGGSNAAVAALSKNGCFAAGSSEVAGHASHAVLFKRCGP